MSDILNKITEALRIIRSYDVKVDEIIVGRFEI